MKIALKVMYDGRPFAGWQRQENAITVQQCLEEAIKRLTGEAAAVTGAGRTDSGVHALGQIAHFTTNSTIPPEKWYAALNAKLPREIRVEASGRVPDDFHARFGACGKHYRYRMAARNVPNPLWDGFVWQMRGELDIRPMLEAANLLVGNHDFKAFMSTGSEVKDTVRKLYTVDLREEEGKIVLDTTGNGFLYNMVRIMAGTLAEIGQGRRDPEDINRAFDTGIRNFAGVTAPAEGLTMMEVFYADGEGLPGFLSTVPRG